MTIAPVSEVTKAVKKRIDIERKIASKCVKAFLAAGYRLGVYDGEEVTLQFSDSYKAVMKALGTTDEDYLLVFEQDEKPDADGDYLRCGYVYFVYGNSGYDLISDYSASKALFERFEEILKPVDDYASTFDT